MPRPGYGRVHLQKAYLPLTLSTSIVLLGGLVTALFYAVLIWKRCS
jgi:hypothetical protein